MTDVSEQNSKPESEIHVGGNINIVRGAKDVNVINQGRGSVTFEAHYGSDVTELSRAFSEIYRHIDDLPKEPDVDKEEIARTVKDIEVEVSEKQPNVAKIKHWLRTLRDVAPKIRLAVLAILADDQLGLSDAICTLAQSLL